MAVNEIKKTILPNEKQLECINNIKGKYLVLAGPGTGKTFTVIRRIKAMLEQGIDPSKILCLTFSTAAANEMKKRADIAFREDKNEIDSGINIYTYHSFCNEIISQNTEAFELRENYRKITDTASRQLIKECIEEYSPKAYRNSKNDPYAFLKVIADKFKEIKRYRLTKEEYFKNLEENPDYYPKIENLKEEIEKIKRKESRRKLSTVESEIENTLLEIEKAKEVWNLYEMYKAKMESENYIDFDDMIGFVLEKFETNPAFLDEIANKYEYILVDEYQDTNKSQNEIVFHLVSALKSQNVFVVGDDDQIIFSFQGANLNTIETFLKKFPDTDVICLTENMRSTQNILDIARLIVLNDSTRLENNPEFKKYNISKVLKAKNETLKEKESKVRLTKYFNIEQEGLDIIDEIEALINSDQCPKDKNNEKNLSEIAILATNNETLAEYAQKLKDRNIPFEIKDGKSIFQIKSSVVLYYYLQLMVNPELNYDKLFKLLLLPPFSFNSKDYLKLYELNSFRGSFIDKIRNTADWVEPKAIETFLKTYDELIKLSSLETVKTIVLETVSKTGIFNYFVNEEINRSENISGLKKLIDTAGEFSQTRQNITLEDFVDYLKTIENDKDLDILTDKAPIPMNAVQLTTYHSAKGREFEYVYMPTLQSSRWDSNRSSFKPNIPVSKSEWKDSEYWKQYRLSDAIKTMYVGLTRAKHTLRLSYVANHGKITSPCSWILGLQEHTQNRDLSEYDLNTYFETSTKALIKRSYDYKKDFNSLIEAKLNDRYYSPSAINRYLNCPRSYLYEDILDLNGISGNADALNYGNAVHSALEFALSKAKEENKYPNKDEITAKFKLELNKLTLSSAIQREILLERGENELNNYYKNLILTPIDKIHAVEYKIKTELDGIKFVGIIDKIEENEDGTFSIYDYKTGSKKSANKISLNEEFENYYLQIGLYKYYFEKTTGKKVKDTKFIFLIDPNNLIEKVITEDETEAIVEKFKNAIKAIENHEFEPIFELAKSSKNCTHCPFKSFCKMDAV